MGAATSSRVARLPRPDCTTGITFTREAYCLTMSHTIGQVMSLMEQNASGIVLLVDGEDKLLATITDGDIRRALLAGHTLEDTAQRLVDAKAGKPGPFFGRPDQSVKSMTRYMRSRGIRHLPVLDRQNRVVNVVFLEALAPECRVPLDALVMAGGFGTRLRPLTNCVPKPLLPIGKRPLLEIIVDRLRRAGVRRVFISIHYLAEQVMDYFGSGEDFGVEITYIRETTPLGTAGAIGLMPPSDNPLLVINGDVLTDVDFRSMLLFHMDHDAALTMAVRGYSIQVPFGVVNCNEYMVRSLVEKPTYSYMTNAGLYILDPRVLAMVEPEQRLDMTELIDRLLTSDQNVCGFPIVEYWQDIGTHSEYERAKRERYGEEIPTLLS